MTYETSLNAATKEMAIPSRNPPIASPETSQATRASSCGIPFRPASDARVASQAVNNVLEPKPTTTIGDLLIAKSETSQATRATTFDMPFRLIHGEAMTAGQTVNCLLEDQRMTTTSTPQYSIFSINEAIPDGPIAPRTDPTLQLDDITTDVVFIDTGVIPTGSRIANELPREMTATPTNLSGPKNQLQKSKNNPQGRVTKTRRHARKPANNKRGRRRRPFYVGDESDAWSTTATVDGPISEFRTEDVGEKTESSGQEGGGTACKEKRERRPTFKHLVWVRKGVEP